MNSIKVGQTIYVTVRNKFTHSEPNLSEFVVTKVNAKSFYARSKDSDHDYRFNQNTMTASSLNHIYTAFLSKEEYLDKVEMVSLCTEIKKSLNHLNVEQLREIKSIITAYLENDNN